MRKIPIIDNTLYKSETLHPFILKIKYSLICPDFENPSPRFFTNKKIAYDSLPNDPSFNYQLHRVKIYKKGPAYRIKVLQTLIDKMDRER